MQISLLPAQPTPTVHKGDHLKGEVGHYAINGSSLFTNNNSWNCLQYFKSIFPGKVLWVTEGDFTSRQFTSEGSRDFLDISCHLQHGFFFFFFFFFFFGNTMTRVLEEHRWKKKFITGFPTHIECLNMKARKFLRFYY